MIQRMPKSSTAGNWQTSKGIEFHKKPVFMKNEQR